MVSQNNTGSFLLAIYLHFPFIFCYPLSVRQESLFKIIKFIVEET